MSGAGMSTMEGQKTEGQKTEGQKPDEVRYTSSMMWVKSRVKRVKKDSNTVKDARLASGCTPVCDCQGPTDDSSSEEPRSDIDSDDSVEWNVVEGIRRIY